MGKSISVMNGVLIPKAVWNIFLVRWKKSGKSE